MWLTVKGSVETGKQWLEVLSLVLPGEDERSVWWLAERGESWVSARFVLCSCN
jgi:hypothetical protein